MNAIGAIIPCQKPFQNPGVASVGVPLVSIVCVAKHDVTATASSRAPEMLWTRRRRRGGMGGIRGYGRRTTDDGRGAMRDGRCAMGDGRWAMDDGRTRARMPGDRTAN